MRIDQKTNERMERERACACESGQKSQQQMIGTEKKKEKKKRRIFKTPSPRSRESAHFKFENQAKRFKMFRSRHIYVYETDPARRGLQSLRSTVPSGADRPPPPPPPTPPTPTDRPETPAISPASRGRVDAKRRRYERHQCRRHTRVTMLERQMRAWVSERRRRVAWKSGRIGI